MSPGQLAILDVGHGNAAVIRHEGWSAVIDAGPRSALLQFLSDEGITRLDVVVISHADEDHIAGLLVLISSGAFTFGKIRLNSDAEKGSKVWDDLAKALDDAQRAGTIDFLASLTPAHNSELDNAPVRLEILGPTSYLAMKGPGAVDRQGRRITSNSISAVVRMWVGGDPIAIFPGDLDQIGLEELHAVGTTDLHARILVFPHHGGRPGASVASGTFAAALLSAVKPECVVFSIGRGVHGTPTPEVVEAIRRMTPAPRIACTQLSEHCAQTVPAQSPSHLTALVARGRERRSCCAGTIVVDFNDPGALLPSGGDHLAFIATHAPTALCQRRS